VFLLSGFHGWRNQFAGHNFSLAALLLVEGISQWAALIHDSELAVGIFQHQDFGAAKGERATRLLELVDDFVVLQGQVLGDGVGGLNRQNPVQIVAGQ
jgi:hypothetical protein